MEKIFILKYKEYYMGEERQNNVYSAYSSLDDVENAKNKLVENCHGYKVVMESKTITKLAAKNGNTDWLYSYSIEEIPFNKKP